MKKFLLVIFALISLNAFSQLQVKEGSFRYVPGGVIEDKLEYTDGNDLPMALIKISTENISEQERMRLVFKGNRETQIIKKSSTGQMWIYISADPATFIEIKHPDYGTYKYLLPESLCDYCVYEIVLQYVELKPERCFLVISSEPTEADIYIDGKHCGKTNDVITDITVGIHELQLKKEGYSTLTKNITMTKGETLKLNETLQVYKEKIINREKINKAEVNKKKVSSSVVSSNSASSSDNKSYGVNFLTLNWAYASSPQHSYGLTIGAFDRVGWFASLMASRDFKLYSAFGKNEGLVILTGENASTRLSAVGGLIFKIGSRVCGRVGAGFGMRTKCWEATDGNWYKYAPDSNVGADIMAGLQLNLNHMTLSVDIVTTNFKTAEVKLGLGVNWKK